jgi:cyclase
LTEECFIPIAAGGGIRTVEQARKILHSGADKVVVNTLVAENSNIISEIASEFGQQSIVASVDVKLTDGEFSVWTDNGSVEQSIGFVKWLENIERLPVGEVYLNSVDRDGTGHGYQLELIEQIPDLFSIPVILAGGAGKYEHISKGLSDARVDAVATAHLFNFVGDGLEKTRKKLLDENFNLATWDADSAKHLLNCV